ncbi:MAG TPA: hypothetical protein VG408_01070 [Actinomycetota bacterium]|nr:hypothetical protein [Actinomycetota bacterium]
MAALAYVLLPFSGGLAFLLSGSGRTRSHGLQAIVLGVLWPVLLYAASGLSSVLTWAIAVVGGITWLAFLILTATGRDPKLPVIGDRLFVLSEDATNEG